MANSWNVIDCYALVTEAYQQATGRKDIAAGSISAGYRP